MWRQNSPTPRNSSHRDGADTYLRTTHNAERFLLGIAAHRGIGRGSGGRAAMVSKKRVGLNRGQFAGLWGLNGTRVDHTGDMAFEAAGGRECRPIRRVTAEAIPGRGRAAGRTDAVRQGFA